MSPIKKFKLLPNSCLFFKPHPNIDSLLLQTQQDELDEMFTNITTVLNELSQFGKNLFEGKAQSLKEFNGEYLLYELDGFNQKHAAVGKKLPLGEQLDRTARIPKNGDMKPDIDQNELLETGSHEGEIEEYSIIDSYLNDEQVHIKKDIMDLGCVVAKTNSNSNSVNNPDVKYESVNELRIMRNSCQRNVLKASVSNSFGKPEVESEKLQPSSEISQPKKFITKIEDTLLESRKTQVKVVRNRQIKQLIKKIRALSNSKNAELRNRSPVSEMGLSNGSPLFSNQESYLELDQDNQSDTGIIISQNGQIGDKSDRRKIDRQVQTELVSTPTAVQMAYDSIFTVVNQSATNIPKESSTCHSPKLARDSFKRLSINSFTRYIQRHIK